MDNNIAIKVNNLTKIYHLYDKPQDRLKEALHPLRKSYHHDFYALNDVSFEIKKGETVGIIGKNGAGKSTLLKIITGVLNPTSGSVEVNGKIASLLELGAGFNPEMTGLENIYLNGTLMGFSKEEMDSKIDIILEFADIGEFIHQQVKIYSSGMFARLAFSMVINVEPDILIVDEALSVGDMAFQMKCFKKFEELQLNNVSILFVTHSLDSIIRYCQKAIVIEAGNKVIESISKEAVDVFKQIMTNNYSNNSKTITKKEIINYDILYKKQINNNQLLNYGNKKIEIIDYCIFNEKNTPSSILDYNKEFTIYMKIQFNEDLDLPTLAFTIKDIKGLDITGTNTYMKNIINNNIYLKDTHIIITFKQKANLQIGKYSLSLGCVNIQTGEIEVYNRLYDCILFEVIGIEEMVGFYDLKSNIEIKDSNV